MEWWIKTIKIGKTVFEMIRNDNEHEAVWTYTDAIKYARVVDDQGADDLADKYT